MSKKTVTMAQVLEAAQKAEELTIQVAQAAKTELETKQDALANGDGTTVVGNKVNVDTPTRGIVTEEEFNALPEAQRNKGLYVIRTEGGGSAGGGVNLLAITFGEDCLGREYTVSAGDEVYSGTVEETFQAVVSVKQPNTEYTISCTDATGEAFSQKVTTGGGFGAAKFVFVGHMDCSVSVSPNGGSAEYVKAVSERGEVPFSPTGLRGYGGQIKTPGNWSFAAGKSDGTVVTVGPRYIKRSDNSLTITINMA